MIKFLSLFLVLLTFQSTAQVNMSSNLNKDKLIGSMIKSALENYHYRKMKVDNDLSKKAFDEYLKNIDYSKQFLFRSDIKSLDRYRYLLDDEMQTGKLSLVERSLEIVSKRVKEAQALQKEFFKKPFDFTKNEEVELDRDKKDHVNNKSEFKERWRKNFKSSVLTRYLTLKETQEVKPSKEDKKKKKKKKKEKKLSEKELRKKAHDAINKKYTELFKRLLKDTKDDYSEKFYNAITNIFDPHTNYMMPKRKEDFDIDISGSLEGIGAVLTEDGPYIKVTQIVPGGAAWRQKELEADDIILMVGEGDAEPVHLVDMRVDNAVRYIRGKKGTEVRLTVKKVDGTKKVIPIIRDVVQVGASYTKSSVLEHKKLGIKLGYIYVPKFYRDFNGGERNCSDDVKKELERLKKEKVNGVILDLRNNGGGALEDARKMTGLFIKEGPVVQIKNHEGKTEVLKDDDKSVTYDGPLIVMINRQSASASEIVAAALQDYGRAVVVGGEFTHGKGTVQAVLDLNRGPIMQILGPVVGAMKITIQKFYRINGDSTQYKGVTPDIILPDPYGYAENREQDLDYSLAWDRVPNLKYKPWGKYNYSFSLLKRRSDERVKKDSHFKKIRESVDYLITRRKDTKISLNKDQVIKENKMNKERAEKLKFDDENKSIKVSKFEATLKENQNIRPGDEKKWNEEFKQKSEDWIKRLRKDPALAESMFIMDDIIKSLAGKVLSMAK